MEDMPCGSAMMKVRSTWIKEAAAGLILYSTLCCIIAGRVEFNTYRLTNDFGFYYTYAATLWSKITDVSAVGLDVLRETFNESPTWKPTVFYTFIAYIPLLVVGSKLLYVAQGFLLGCVILLLWSRFLYRWKEEVPIGSMGRVILGLLVASDSVFLRETLNSGVDAVFMLIIIAALNQNKLSAAYCFVGAGCLIRSNSFTLVVALIGGILLTDAKRGRRELIYCLIPSLAYVLAYVTYYGQYPVSWPFALFYHEGITYEAWNTYVSGFFGERLGVTTLLGKEYSLPTFAYLLSDSEGLNIVLQNYFLKLTSFMGFQYDIAMFPGEGYSYAGRVIRIIVTWAFVVPGYWNIAQRSRLASSYSIRRACTTTILVALVSSLFIANFRYTLFVLPVVIAFGLLWWKEIIRGSVDGIKTR